jgi:hypothetical protein
MPKKAKKGGKKGKKSSGPSVDDLYKKRSQASGFVYEAPVLATEQSVMLDVKLVSWSYLNFRIRTPITATLLAIKHIITERHGGAITLHTNPALTASRPFQQSQSASPPAPARLDKDLLDPVSPPKPPFDAACTGLVFYKGTFCPENQLTDADDLKTLEDLGFIGSADPRLPVHATLFYDFQASGSAADRMAALTEAEKADVLARLEAAEAAEAAEKEAAEREAAEKEAAKQRRQEELARLINSE